jgi:outer membrane receptor protein involved in Fe transport
LRTGFANLDHVPGYTQCNFALAHEFHAWKNRKPLNLRLSVVNLFDRSYLLRSGTGIGEFAPQYGPRRGLFVGLTQQF